MDITISESGMDFGPFKSDCVFHIEKCETYANLHDGVKMAEFILILKDRKIIRIIEAKSSAPNPENRDRAICFKAYIDEIAQKLNNALNLWLALGYDRHGCANDSLPYDITDCMGGSTKIYLVLVIKGHEKRWLPPVQEALNKELLVTRKIWRSEVLVINDEIARKYHMIA